MGRSKEPDHSGRSAEERAAAAAERARRRGHEPPPMTHAGRMRNDQEAQGPRPAPEPLPEPEAEPAAPKPAPEPLPEPAPEPAEPQPAPEPVPLPSRTAPVPERDPLPPAASARRGRRAPGPPLTPRPRQAPPLRGRSTGGPRKPPTAPRRPLPPPGPRPSRGRTRGLALVVLLVLAGLAFVALKTFQPFHGDPSGTVAVTVPEGADAGDIGDVLAERGVVASGAFFSINATVTGRRGNLRPGDYTLQRDMSYGAVLDALEKGPKAKVVKTFTVTVPEGLSIRETAPVVRKGGITGDYARAANSERALRRARRLGLPRGTDTTEGFLFPATYEMVSGADARDLVDRQLAAFADNLRSIDMRRAKARNLTRYDVAIIASMVEREAQLDRERPLVAAVIHNRLREGMTLGIDATIRYAENNWTSPLKVSELERPGPYNSRLNRGLPPTPIGNPGLASLKAAADPARVDHLFYVVKPGTCGEHAFSSTDAQFARDRARYDAERAAAGGKSPTNC